MGTRCGLCQPGPSRGSETPSRGRHTRTTTPGVPRGRRHIPAPSPSGAPPCSPAPAPSGVAAIFRRRRRRDAGGSRLGGVQGAPDPNPCLREDHLGAQPRRLLPERRQLCPRHARHLHPRYRWDRTPFPVLLPWELSSGAGTGTRGWAHRGTGQRREDTGICTGKGHAQGHRDTGPDSNGTGRGTGHWDTGTWDIDKNTARTQGHGTQTNTWPGQRRGHETQHGHGQTWTGHTVEHSMDTGTWDRQEHSLDRRDTGTWDTAQTWEHGTQTRTQYW